MTRNAIKAKDLPLHAQRRAKAKTKNRRGKQAKDIDLSKSTFGQLTKAQKDDLLKQVALRMGLISPD